MFLNQILPAVVFKSCGITKLEPKLQQFVEQGHWAFSAFFFLYNCLNFKKGNICDRSNSEL